MLAIPDALPSWPVERREARGLGGGAGYRAPVRFLYGLVAAGMVRMPVVVPYLADPPAPRFGLGEHRVRHGRIDDHGFVRGRIVHQPDIIIAERRNADDLK